MPSADAVLKWFAPRIEEVNKRHANTSDLTEMSSKNLGDTDKSAIESATNSVDHGQGLFRSVWLLCARLIVLQLNMLWTDPLVDSSHMEKWSQH